MHDCEQTRERLIDLVFDELASPEARRMLAEVKACAGCLAQYRSMTETLCAFDVASDAAMPGESYWPGYDARLRARLARVQPSMVERLKDWVSGLLTLRPVPMAAAVAVILLALVWFWNWRRPRLVAPPRIVYHEPRREGPAAAPSPNPAWHDRTAEVSPEARKKRRPKPSGFRRQPAAREDEVEQTIALIPRFGEQPAAPSLFGPETAKHFEKAQLLLRSFRNADDDLAYDRQLSRRLLYQNILLRREAETKKNLPAEEMLASLEPFLLDIANLSDKPSAEELGDIKERMQRKEMIASLQIHSTQP